jgi:adenine-specific DNA methylase
MRYYGCKTKLLPFIEEVVKKTELNGGTKFVDLFSGTSEVGKHFKRLGYTVISNDFLEFAYSISKSYIESNELPQFKKLRKELLLGNEVFSVFNYLNSLKTTEDGFIFQNYSPNGGRQYFTDENALKVDAIRKQIYLWQKADLLNESEYYYLITSLLEAVNLVSNVSGTYAAYLKTWDKRALNSLVLSPLSIIESGKKNKAFKSDANTIIKEINCDILYLDPPYNNRQYASNYFLLELIAEGWFETLPEIYGETGMRKYDHQKSSYASKITAKESLNELIENTKARFILLSYNNEGFIKKDEIIEILSKKGEVECFTETHKRYKSVNQKASDPKHTDETIYFVKTQRANNRANNLDGKTWLQRSFSIWRDIKKTKEEKALSHPAIFPIDLASNLIELFTKGKDSTVLDCFAGSGSTLIAGLMKDMKVIGVDLHSEFRNEFVKRLENTNPLYFQSAKFEYHTHDAKKLSEIISANSVDFCFTSPPYWDILNLRRTADYKQNINYSESFEDLGNLSDYKEFLESLKEVFTEVYKVLKPKSYFIVNVMDLRKKDKFFPLHSDASTIAQEVGFKFEDIIIWDRQNEYNSMRPLGYPYKFIVNKVHEYILIFRKPDE